MNVLVDTSVVVKWFHAEGERHVEEARALLEAHLDGRVTASVLDLTMYELGNVLLGPLRSSADHAVAALRILAAACEALRPDDSERRDAAELVIEYGLTYYDAAYAAVARRREQMLVTADRALLDAGLGISPPDAVRHVEGGPPA